MDTSSPAAFVNAQLLPRYLNRRVRAVVQIVQSQQGKITGKSTDERELHIIHAPQPQFTTFVEVIGAAVSNNTIQAEIITNFGDKFDMESYNRVCELANGSHQKLFI
ncbi:hypothetical protein ACHQM5_021177 [Ranunculus cassubicifolius]